MNKNILMGVGIFILGGLGFILLGNSGTFNGKIISAGEFIEISLSDVSENARFYNYEGIEYFVVKTKEGSVKTAFNACDVCYGNKKGYRQEGIDMVCNNCGNHYTISELGTKNLRGGGCWPGYLPSKIQGNTLVIKKSDLEAGRYRF